MIFNKTFKNALFFTLFFVLFLLFSPVKTEATGIESPSLLDVRITSEKRLQAEGLTPNNSRVLVYIDGKYKKSANIREINQEEVNSFHYLSDHRIEPGRHKVMVVSQKHNSTIMSPPVDYDFQVFGDSPDSEESSSKESDTGTFPDEHTKDIKTPTPILIHPHSNNLSNVRPNILGLGANHTQIKIYLDGELLTETGFLYHPSGTAGFSVAPQRNLKAGKHQVWAQAVNSAGQASKRSNVLTFTIKGVKAQKIATPQTPQILNPENNTVKPVEELYVSGVVDQKVEKIRIYIDGELYSKVTPTTSNGRSEFDHDLQDLSRGDHTLYVTSVIGNQESAISSKVNFTATKPRIDKGVKEEQTSTSSKTATNGEQKDQQVATSSTFFDNFQNFKYLLFAILILLIIAWVLWANKDSIKNNFNSQQ